MLLYIERCKLRMNHLFLCVFENINEFLWTVSEISLWWIQGTEMDWKPWVKNRVNFIRSNSEVCNWKYVGGNLNSADVPTWIN